MIHSYDKFFAHNFIVFTNIFNQIAFVQYQKTSKVDVGHD